LAHWILPQFCRRWPCSFPTEPEKPIGASDRKLLPSRICLNLRFIISSLRVTLIILYVRTYVRSFPSPHFLLRFLALLSSSDSRTRMVLSRIPRDPLDGSHRKLPTPLRTEDGVMPADYPSLDTDTFFPCSPYSLPLGPFSHLDGAAAFSSYLSWSLPLRGGVSRVFPLRAGIRLAGKLYLSPGDGKVGEGGDSLRQVSTTRGMVVTRLAGGHTHRLRRRPIASATTPKAARYPGSCHAVRIGLRLCRRRARYNFRI